MAGRFPDEQIAATLNRLGLKTGTGSTWIEGRIRTVRSYHDLPAYDATTANKTTITLEEACQKLGVTHKVVRRLIEAKKLPATQVVPCAPWEIPANAVESEDVLREVKNIKRRVRVSPKTTAEDLPMFADL